MIREIHRPIFLVVQGEYGEGYTPVQAYYTRAAAVKCAERLKLHASFKWCDYAQVLRIRPGESIIVVYEVSKRD